MKIIKTYETPTDIYILGCYISNQHSALKVDDDYTGIGITNIKKSLGLNSNGHISIVSDAELSSLKFMSKPDDSQVLRLPNFEGDILLGVFVDDKDLTSEIDLDDYLLHQIPDDGEDCEVFIQLPLGTDISNVHDAHEFLTNFYSL